MIYLTRTGKGAIRCTRAVLRRQLLRLLPTPSSCGTLGLISHPWTAYEHDIL